MRREGSRTGISSAQTWEDLLAAHEKWLLDFNYQHHFAHEQCEDGCHSPAAVLGWVKGMQPEPERIYRAFSAVGEMRSITKAGYVRFRDYLLYGEQNLAGERVLVNLFQAVSSKPFLTEARTLSFQLPGDGQNTPIGFKDALMQF